MSDLVARLRSESDDLLVLAQHPAGNGLSESAALLREAADHIEKMQALVEAARVSDRGCVWCDSRKQWRMVPAALDAQEKR